MRAAALLALLALAALLVAPALASEYYKVLGISVKATTRDIKKAYRTLSKEHHPDKNPGNQEAADLFVKINTAYTVLVDEELRHIYDTRGEEGLKQHQQNQNQPSGHFDFFGNFFGGQSGGVPRGPDIRFVVEVTLEELYLGTSFQLETNKQLLCDHCHGTGAEHPEDVHTCPVCHGSGTQRVKQQMAPGFFMQQDVQCSKCGGKGKTIKQTCHVCHGKGAARGSRSLSVEIEKGRMDMEEIVYEEMGDQAPGIAPGNLIVVIRQLPHAQFFRQGAHLQTVVNLSLEEALLGFERELVHLDGHKVTLKRTGVTQHDEVQEIHGEGMPVNGNPSQYGILYVRYTITLPYELTVEQVQAFRAAFKA